MIAKEKIEQIISPKLNEGLFIVDVTITPSNSITVVLDGDNGVGIDACVAISREVEAELDEEGVIFELVVTSAGVGQPLKLVRQYKKNIGREVEVMLNSGEKVSGELKVVTETDFEVEYTVLKLPEGGKRKVKVVEKRVIPYNEVKSTKVLVSFK
ncbi:MAG TPA: ribosome assembly cofactor RimP [Tenuifilaceae bacterium]|mgnify:CR=1 FL=1|nr:ribosome assembly cofactor RimP [Tenuifilaceae bacterium]